MARRRFKLINAGLASSGGGGSTVLQLTDLSDVNSSTPTARNVLVADGVDWESRPLVEADISDLQAYQLAGTYLSDVVDDLTPQLGGDLDLNGFDITGTGNIDITGDVTLTTGDLYLDNQQAINWDNEELLYYETGGAEIPADPDFGDVVLLLQPDEADGATTTVDKSNTGHTAVFTGDAHVEQGTGPFGDGCYTFDGSGDYIAFADSPDWVIFASDYTIEYWVQLSSLSGSQCFICQDEMSTDLAFYTGYEPTTNSLSVEISESGAGKLYRGTGTNTWFPTVGVWYHVAHVWHNTVSFGRRMGTFIDGVQTGTWHNLTGFEVNDSAAPLHLGARPINIQPATPVNYLNGKLANIRLTQGVPRYPDGLDFTAPTTRFGESETELTIVGAVPTLIVGDPLIDTRIDGDDITLAADTVVQGDITISGDTTLGNDLTIPGELNVAGDIITDSAVIATGAVTGANLNVFDWDTAFGWGNHAAAGYLPVADPTFSGDLTGPEIIAWQPGVRASAGLQVDATSAGSAAIYLQANGGTADSNNWGIDALSTDQLRFSMASDADAAMANWMLVSRSGGTATNIAMTATDFALTGDVSLVGGLSMRGAPAVNTSLLMRTSVGGSASDIQFRAEDNTLTALIRWNESSNILQFFDRDPISVETMTFDFDTGDLASVGNVTAANLNVSNWDTAFGWGDHDGLYEVIDATIVRTGDAAWNATDWDTAFGWGNHTSGGYAVKASDETITGRWNIEEAAEARLGFNDPLAAADEGFWELRAANTKFVLRGLNDAKTLATNALRISRSSYSPNLIELLTDTEVTGTLDVSSSLTATSYGGISQANLVDKSATETISGSWLFEAQLVVDAAPSSAGSTITARGPNSASIGWEEEDATADSGIWDVFASADTLNFRTLNDARNSAATYLTIERTGTVVDSIDFKAKTTFDETLITNAGSGSTSGVAAIQGYYTAADSLLNIGSLRSSGATVIGFAIKPSTTTSLGYVSAAGNSAFGRSAIELSGSKIAFLGASSTTTAVDTAITMTEIGSLDRSSGDLTVTGDIRPGTGCLYLAERGSAAADVTAEGQFWVKNDTPNTPMYTDDAGNDYVLQTGTTLMTTTSAYKTSNTSRTSTATLADDTDIAGIALENDRFYKFEAYLLVECPASAIPDFKWDFQFSQTPQGTDVTRHAITENAAILDRDNGSMTIVNSIDMTSGERVGISIVGSFISNATTGGTLDLRWAQNTSNANQVILYQNSYVSITDLGPA